MEKSSSINGSWKLCIIASVVSITTLVLFLREGHGQTLTLTLLTTINDISSSSSSSPPPPPLSSSNETSTEPLTHRNFSNQLVIVNKTDHRNGDDRENKYYSSSSSSSSSPCDMYDGKWVYDPNASPLYETKSCPFLSDQVSCQRNGRPDFAYEKWSWEAINHINNNAGGCEIPRFNGKDMLERLRGKRVIIIGDSLNRNQWESLACLLYSSLSHPSRAHVNVHSGVYKLFQAKDYNCTVEFYWSPFLVQLEIVRETGDRLLKLDKLSETSRRWRGADVMIFNSGHWWVHRGKLKSWDWFQYEGKLVAEMDIDLAFGKAMKTWSKWVDQNVDVKKTQVFFRSISAEHKGKQWCYNETHPITDDMSYEQMFPKRMIAVVERTMQRMKTPVKYLNITRLSEYRRDAHPTVYNTKGGKMLIALNQRKPESLADCSHWCLPGVPDTWNRLVYASLIL